MNIKALRSDYIYRKVAEAPPQEKVELFRSEMLAPFMRKWDIQQIPFKSDEPFGFDVLMLNNMMNRAPDQITGQIEYEIELISSEVFWANCYDAVRKSVFSFIEHGIKLPVSDYLFTIQLGNPASPSLMLSEGYSGDGGDSRLHLVYTGA